MGKFLVVGFFITQSALAGYKCTSTQGEEMLIKDVALDQIVARCHRGPSH